jgi:hypothetical protein
MTEQQSLERMQGKIVKFIEHTDLIGNVTIHFIDGSSIQIFAQEKASQQIMIFEPNEKAPETRH